MKRGAKRGLAIGLAVAGAILVLSLVIPGLHSFVFRNPVPHLFWFGSLIWWLTRDFIPPNTASQIIICLLTLAIGAGAGWFSLVRKRSPYAIALIVAGAIVVWAGILWWLGMGLIRHH